MGDDLKKKSWTKTQSIDFSWNQIWIVSCCRKERGEFALWRTVGTAFSLHPTCCLPSLILTHRHQRPMSTPPVVLGEQQRQMPGPQTASLSVTGDLRERGKHPPRLHELCHVGLVSASPHSKLNGYKKLCLRFIPSDPASWDLDPRVLPKYGYNCWQMFADTVSAN